MKVILNKNIDRVGPVGNIVNVRDGYARNYLIPKGLAVMATPENIKIVEKVKSKEILKEKELHAQAGTLAQKINEMSATLEVNVGEDEKLYGSVSNSDIQEILKEKGIEVDRKDILLKKPIRTVGAYQVEISCHTNVRGTLKLWVVQKK